MARTYRNRHAVPHGYVVRDGGTLFYPSCCPNKEAQRASWRARYPDRCPCHPRWDQVCFRRGIYRKELKKYRKPHYRQYRAKMKDRMRHERWEEVIPYRRTSGWLTW
jgi:hypothetical protein